MATAGELDVNALVDTPADKLSEKNAERFAYSLEHVEFEAPCTLAKLQVKKPSDKLCESLGTHRRACLHTSGLLTY